MDPHHLEKLNELCTFLDQAGARYAILQHIQALTSPEDGVSAGLGDLADMAPAFILKTERGFIVAVIRGDRRISYKKIKKVLGLKDVSLASPDRVKQLTGAEAGTVSPVNPGLPTILDACLLERKDVYGGCGVPLHTLKIRVEDMVAVTGAHVFDFTEEKPA